MEPMSLEQFKAHFTPLAVLRRERNARLAACDWTQVPDAPLSEEQRAAWAAYRQALRDLPETTDPTAPKWPVPPDLTSPPPPT